jgi:LuxR family quorum sensing-dependent transcriptional regulator
MWEFAHAEAWTFLREAPVYRDVAELDAHFARVMAAFGFDRFATARLDGRHGQPQDLMSHNINEWTAYYADQGYVSVDACARYAWSGRPTFTWSEARRQHAPDDEADPRKAARLWGEAAEQGMHDGLIIRSLGPAGEVLLTRMVTGDKMIRPADRAILDSIAVVFSTLRFRLLEQAYDRPTAALLTQRETECLRLAGQGLRDTEIAVQLAVSRKTVNFHIENAKRKLGAPTRLAAFNRAVDLQILGST